MFTSRSAGWMMPCSAPRSGQPLHRWLRRDGQTRYENYTRTILFILFGIISAMLMAAMPGYALIIFCLARIYRAASSQRVLTGRFADGKRQAITPRFG